MNTETWTIVVSVKLVCQFALFALAVVATLQGMARRTSPLYSRLITCLIFWAILYGSGGVDLIVSPILRWTGIAK